VGDARTEDTTLIGEIHVSANCSLTPRDALVFFVGVAVGSLALAVLLAIRGFWPVLPFAGLELLALGAALVVSQRRGRYREVISVFPDRVVIERTDGGRVSRSEFPRAWARVELVASRHRGHPGRLLVGSHGRRCEVGRTLTDEERRSMGERLKSLVAGDD
jgi:uncharacterized membrane protein